ncbi:MAG: YidC/Oxa1 family membrane protein insertase [Treponema sp.]|nr:YidC/Oxa1 family membrane protein insertase [Treponema sp.]
MAEFFWTTIVYPLYTIIEVSFKVFFAFFKNPGMATIGVSVTVTLLCLPLYIVAEAWQDIERKKQKQMEGGIARIKKTFKGDEQYMLLTTFYRQNRYHPLMALRSSFGLLIQIPFFMAAYAYLSNLELLQNCGFLFISDMGKADETFWLGSFPVNILPIAMTLINIAGSAVYTRGFKLKEKVPIYAMALIFLAILYNSPAGLVLYWTMNNVLSLIKNIFYKIKNPMKALYIILCALVAGGLLYLAFVHGGTTKKRIYASIALVLLLAAPLLPKLANFLQKEFLAKIEENKALRFKTFLFCALGLCFLLGLFIPSSLITSSVQEFSDIGGKLSPLFFVKHCLFQGIGLFVLWPICLFFLFGNKVKTLLAFVFAAAFFGALTNALAFSGDYGSMSAMMIFLDGFKQMKGALIFLNALILAAELAAVLFIFKRFPKTIESLALIAAAASLILGAFEAAKISSSYKDFQNRIAAGAQKEDAVKPFFTFSKSGKNVLVIMLDRAEGAYAKAFFEDRPDLKEKFSGFTFYENTVSYNGHTLLSAPSLFGGYEYTPLEMNKRSGESNLQKNNEALLLLPRIFTEQAGFEAFSADMPWANFSYIPDLSITDSYPKIKARNTMRRYTDYWKSLNSDKIAKQKPPREKIKRNLFWLSIFRSSPAFARRLIYDKSKWWSVEDNDNTAWLDSYSVLDLLPELTAVEESGNYYNSFSNELTHEEKILVPPKYQPEAQSDPAALASSRELQLGWLGFSGNAASYVLLSKWFDYLKANGVYDNTRIVIASDHGIGYGAAASLNYETPILSNGYPKDHFHAILFEKDFGAEGPIQFDQSAFMTVADVPSMVLKGIVKDAKNPWTGKDVTNEMKAKGAVITSSNRHQPDYHIRPNHFTIEDDEWYTVKDNIFKDENWTKGVAE